MSDYDTNPTALGNTNSKAVSGNFSAKNLIMTFQLSQYDKQEKIVEMLKRKSSNLLYLLICEHDGPSEKHRHLYVQYKYSLKWKPENFLGIHVEKCLGSAQRNIAYLKAEDAKHLKLGVKSEVILEEGEASKRGGFVVKDISKMETDELMDLPIQYARIVETEISKRNNDIEVDEWYKEIKVFYIWGISGIGKTCKAKEIAKEHGYNKINVIKCRDNFYHGIGTANCAIYDDFRDTDMKAVEFINLIDYNSHPLNIKGGSVINHYNLIIITSIFDPNLIYRGANEETREQWIRRIEIIHLEESNF